MIFKPASIAAANAVGVSMRETDRREMLALGLDPLTAPAESVRVSDPDLRWSLYEGDRVVGVCGATRYSADAGVAWLLTADGFGQNPRRVLDVTHALVARMHRRYPVLFNWIDERNVRSLRWLRAAGFFPTSTLPLGTRGEPFTCHVSLRKCAE